MAGHSKWANIKHKKERADAKKGKIFSRVSKEIINSVKLSGPDPKANTRLRIAIQKAKEANFPSDNIERLIKKASSADQEAYHEMQYELYGHGGIGLIIDVMTDNKNRIASEIRIATNKRGGTIAVPGAVAFNFDKKGILTLPQGRISEDELFALATDAGAEDFTHEEGYFIITTAPNDLYAVKEAIERCGHAIEETSIEMVPKSIIEISDEDTVKANLALIEWLEGIDDVDAVYHNMAIL